MKGKLLLLMLTLFMGLSITSCITVWEEPHYGRKPIPPGHVYRGHKYKYHKHHHKYPKHYYKKHYDRDDDDDDWDDD